MDFSRDDKLKEAKDRLSIADAWSKLGLPGECRPGRPMLSPLRPDKKKGSFSVSRCGRLFKDFANAEHKGDVVTFVQLACGLDVKDAIRKVLELAGVSTDEHMRHVKAIKPRPVVAPGFSLAARQKPVFPTLYCGDETDWEAVATLRGLAEMTVRLAVTEGVLRFAVWHNLPAWIVMDCEGVNAQARRMDGQKYTNGMKALTFPGSWAKWPIGATMMNLPDVWLVEGGPDFLAARELADGKANVVAMFGASMPLHAAALPYFAGKRVTIWPHRDEAGANAAQKWREQLETAGATVTVDEIPEGQKDLNDFLIMKNNKTK